MAEVVKIQEDLSREQIKGLFLAFRLENMSQVEKTFGYVIEEAVTKTKHEKTWIWNGNDAYATLNWKTALNYDKTKHLCKKIMNH